VQEAIENEYQHAFVKKNQMLLDEYKQAVKIAPDTVVVEPFLCKFLREHQRQGVQFMFECVLGLRDFDGNGCILADDMGLGKTFQSVTLLWTLLTRKCPPRPVPLHDQH
jgi:SNF2 family DNA or RNA helicase